MISPSQSEQIIRIIHFNDVYNVEPRTKEPVGGAARFKTAIHSMRTESSLILFSGDCLGPSLLSTYTKGEQMVPVLNDCQVDCAVLGNHDFDYGIDQLSKIISQTSFPWLLSNAFDSDGQSIAGSTIYHIIEKNGKKFGLIGLVEQEWLSILSTIDKDDIKFEDFVQVGRSLAKYLKENEGVDYIIALTHMRNPNDIRLAQNVPEIDLILGGHDHITLSLQVNKTFIIKSGTDFKNFTSIDLTFQENSSEPDISIQVIDVSSEFSEDLSLKNQLAQYESVASLKMDNIIGYLSVNVDGRFSSIRTGETNLGNLITDIMLSSTRADLALLHSGTFRSDEIHQAGPFRLRDLINILPTSGSMVVLSASGKTIWQALENGVSAWPSLEGRFPQVAGVTFTFDPSRPPGHRVNPQFIRIQGRRILLDQKYRLVTKLYLFQGKDGYECLRNCEVLVSEDECPEMITAIQNYFSIKNSICSELNDHDNSHLIGRRVEPKIENRITMTNSTLQNQLK